MDKKLFIKHPLTLILTIFFSESSAIQDSVINNTISKVIINKINIKAVIRFFFFLFIILFLKNYQLIKLRK